MADNEMVQWASFVQQCLDEINRHKYFASRHANRDLGMAAMVDWIRHYAPDLLQHVRKTQGPVVFSVEFTKFMSAQIVKIRLHKYLRSEAAKRDLGVEAVIEWVRVYSLEFRREYERQNGPVMYFQVFREFLRDQIQVIKDSGVPPLEWVPANAANFRRERVRDYGPVVNDEIIYVIATLLWIRIFEDCWQEFLRDPEIGAAA